jgi:hypothetical protein
MRAEIVEPASYRSPHPEEHAFAARMRLEGWPHGQYLFERRPSMKSGCAEGCVIYARHVIYVRSVINVRGHEKPRVKTSSRMVIYGIYAAGGEEIGLLFKDFPIDDTNRR